jgi:hypothetical protein
MAMVIPSFPKRIVINAILIATVHVRIGWIQWTIIIACGTRESVTPIHFIARPSVGFLFGVPFYGVVERIAVKVADDNAITSFYLRKL